MLQVLEGLHEHLHPRDLREVTQMLPKALLHCRNGRSMPLQR